MHAHALPIIGAILQTIHHHHLHQNTMMTDTTARTNRRVRFSLTAPSSTATIPHVVRVTFLGAAGIVHNPSTSGPNNNGVDEDPTKLCVAASISRNRIARGITSGLSGALRQPSRHTHSNDGRTGRYVAVWERKNDRTSKSNTLMFEEELQPCGDEEDGFAPKTFCLTLGLATGADTTDALPIAIPVGCADFVITGKETLDGNPIQLDLPLTGGLEAEKHVPLLDLTDGTNAAAAVLQTNLSPKNVKNKKSMMSRLFSRTNQNNSQQANISETTSNDQTSIFQRQHPPTIAERAQFLQKYAIDPSGGAVLRIGLEVFQRGSELEKVFRTKNRKRRGELRRKVERHDQGKSDGDDDVAVPQSEIARTTGGTLPLVDNAVLPNNDEISSHASLDSESSGTTWDETIIYTVGTLDSETNTVVTPAPKDDKRIHTNQRKKPFLKAHKNDVEAQPLESARTTIGASSLVSNVAFSGNNEISSNASLDSGDSGTTWDESIFYIDSTPYSETNTTTAANDGIHSNQRKISFLKVHKIKLSLPSSKFFSRSINSNLN